MAVTNRYKKPKLSWGRPRRVQRPKSMPNVLGRRPIPNGTEIALCTSQDVHKVALGPSATEADAHTFASLRSLPAALRASISSFASCRS